MDSFSTLKENARVPQKYKKLVRRSKKTSFIYPNGNSFRVVDPLSKHYNFIKKHKKIYSTSANENKKSFEYNYAFDNADIVVLTKEDFFETNGSTIIRLSSKKLKKIR